MSVWRGPELAGESQREPKWVKESRNEWEWQWQSEPERARVSKSKPKWARESLAHKYLAHRLAHKKSHLRAVRQKREPTLQFIVSKPVLSLATEINHIELIFCQKITKPLNWFCFLWIFTQPLQLAGDRTRLNMMALSKRHKKMQNSHWLYLILNWILAQ